MRMHFCYTWFKYGPSQKLMTLNINRTANEQHLLTFLMICFDQTLFRTCNQISNLHIFLISNFHRWHISEFRSSLSNKLS